MEQLTEKDFIMIYNRACASNIGGTCDNMVEALKQKGVIKKSALEEARLHYEYIDSFYKRKMSVLITDVIVLKDKYEQAIDEKEAEIERLKGGNGQERTQGQ